MLRLSKKADYAIILLSYLHQVDAPVSAQEVASQYDLPQPMIANILKDLANAGMLESKRGKQGGYQLLLPLNKISVASVIQAVDQPFSLMECAEQNTCNLHKQCPTRDPLLVLHQEIKNFLNRFTLNQIVENSQPHQSSYS